MSGGKQRLMPLTTSTTRENEEIKKKEIRWRKFVLFVSQSLNCPEFRGLTPSEATLKKIIYPLPVPRGCLDKRILSLRMCRGNSAQSFLLYGQFPHLWAVGLLDTLSDWGSSPVWILLQEEVSHFSKYWGQYGPYVQKYSLGTHCHAVHTVWH